MPPPIINLHGLRRDEVEPRLDRELDRLFMEYQPECVVIVGRGKVVGPEAARVLLKHPLVRSFLNENGRIRVDLGV